MSSRTQARINLKALRHNLSQVKQLAPAARVMAVVKANAYGHGIREVADALHEADGLAVARLEEAIVLREHGIRGRVLVLSENWSREQLAFCAQHNIDAVLHSTENLDIIAQHAFSRPLNLWLNHDSGMHRLGLDSTSLAAAAHAMHDSPQVAQLCYLSHFSSADETDGQATREQIARFNGATHALPRAPRSLANSAAIIRGYIDDSDWVRPGIMLYGANPLQSSLLARYPVQLQPVMTLTAPIIAIRGIPAGESVGYNRRWTAARDSLIATVAIGYGDGYPRHAGNGTPVMIDGRPSSVVGTVSMDMITIDVTDCSGVAVGDPVTLWGDKLPAEKVAECAGTIAYELFTAVTPRVPRIYV